MNTDDKVIGLTIFFWVVFISLVFVIILMASQLKDAQRRIGTLEQRLEQRK